MDLGFRSTDRISVFIDGPNLYSATKSLGFDIDYKKLHALFASQGRLMRAFYYSAVREDEEFSSIRPLLDWLDYNGFHVVTKPTKEFTDSMGRRKIKGNLDVEMTVDMMEATAFSDQIVLFSGDGDFRYAVEAVQRRGARVTVVSSLEAGIIADELRRQSDQFVDLVKLQDAISRPERHDKTPLVQRASLSATRVAAR